MRSQVKEGFAVFSGAARLDCGVATDIKSVDEQEVRARFADWKQPAYRVGQVLEWLYAHRAAGWEAMTNLPKALRERLAAEFTLQTPELARKQGLSADTTQKFLSGGWRIMRPRLRAC